MTDEEFVAATQRGCLIFEGGDHDGALAVFLGLAESDLPDLDRSIICVNVAVIHGKKGDTQGALTWYDKGIELESRHARFDVAEMRAGYLVQLGRKQEGLASFERLLERSDLTLRDRERVTQSVRQLEAAASEVGKPGSQIFDWLGSFLKS